MKRACDCCIRRKVRCDGELPCRRCAIARPRLSCTYLTPARKRGPKPAKAVLLRGRPRRITSLPTLEGRGGMGILEAPPRAGGEGDDGDDDSAADSAAAAAAAGPRELEFLVPLPATGGGEAGSQDARRVSYDALRSVVEVYGARMYPVWPVIDASKLLSQLEDGTGSTTAYILATALCAATMAQLHLPPMDQQGQRVSSKDLERECSRARATCDYRERPSLNHVLTSFFLHVYHAKMDSRNAALLFIQEAILLARLLKLDEDDGPYHGEDSESVADGCIVYLLLWVSERGYAIQYGLPISLQGSVSLSQYELYKENVYLEGLFNLARLFVAFDRSSVPQFSRYRHFPVSSQRLVRVEKTLKGTLPSSTPFEIVQKADFIVTKQWMRILVWQQAMSRGLLSSSSEVKSLSFTFPAGVAKDLLRWMGSFSTDDLMPLGRDQLVKLFEVTNTLADVILCNTKLAERENRRLGPVDYLHGLYQTISPLLELDPCFSSMLRKKTADALIRAPARIWELGFDETSDGNGDSESDSVVQGEDFGDGSIL